MLKVHVFFERPSYDGKTVLYSVPKGIVDWLYGFYAVSAIFQPYNGGTEG